MGLGGCNPPPRSCSARGDMGELFVDETQDEFLSRYIADALDALDGESARDELAGAGRIDAAGL